MLSLLIGLPSASSLNERFRLIVISAILEVMETFIIVLFVSVPVYALISNLAVAAIAAGIWVLTSVICWLIAIIRSR